MATARLLEELAALGTVGDLDLTVVGAEPHLPYNRVLLSSVLQGTHSPDAIMMRTRSWYDGHGVRLLTGIRVTGIDRTKRVVHLGDGRRLPYDRLVLATGGGPVLPPIRGVVTPENRLHPRVFAFRTLSDCTQLLRAIRPAQRAVVVGGGLLGLEAARGLALRGLTVDIVEVGEHLMSGRLDPAPGRVLRRAVERLGIGVHTGVKAVGIVGDHERLDGVRLDDGYVLTCDVLVLASGVRPSVSLARGCGLAVGHAVVVDDQLRSVTDPAVHALGDCAEHRGRVPGLVAPAWEQAAVLARVVSGDASARYEGSRLVTRLRASNLDVAVIGSPSTADDAGPDDEIVEFANPLRGVYRRLVVRDGRLHGAVLLGELDGVGLLVQYFDRGALLPADPVRQLLADRVGAGPAASGPLPDDAQVCQCNGVSAGAVRVCARAGAATVDDVAARTRATTGCGSCAGAVTALLGEVADRMPDAHATRALV
jgi:assimilatory nitrate reductase electron transfer subunit